MKLVRINFFMVFLLVFLSSCIEAEEKQEDVPKNQKEELSLLRELAEARDQNGQSNFMLNYVLKDSLDKQELKYSIEAEETERKLWQEYLHILNEPDYGKEESTVEFIRFTYFHSLLSSYVAVTLLHENQTYSLRAKKVKFWRDEHDPKSGPLSKVEKIADSISHPILKREWDMMFTKLEACFFWDIRGNLTTSISGFDGATWGLEAELPKFQSYNYHRIRIWEPRQKSFREACHYLIDLCDPDFGLQGKIPK